MRWEWSVSPRLIGARQPSKIPVIMSWPSRNGVDHDLQVMIDGSGGAAAGG